MLNKPDPALAFEERCISKRNYVKYKDLATLMGKRSIGTETTVSPNIIASVENII